MPARRIAFAVPRILLAYALGAAALVLVFAAPASAEPARWSAPSCSYSVEFPAEPRIEAQSQTTPNPAPGEPGQMEMISAGFAKEDRGVLLAACAAFDIPMGEVELLRFVDGLTSDLMTRVLSEGPCALRGAIVPCRTVESVEVVAGAPRRMITSHAIADGSSVFFLQILTMPDSTPESLAVDAAFKASVAPVVAAP